MIVLFAAMIVFFFLELGALAFLVCILIPPGRKRALSIALWFAALGACLVSFLVLAMLGVVTVSLALQATNMKWQDAPRLISAAGWGAIIVALVVTCFVASAAAWLHQAIIHRFTFALFRLYAMFVAAGIGSVIGLLIVVVAIISKPFPEAEWVAAFSIPVLMILFGTIAYWHAHALRGKPPSQFIWITSEEFRGPNKLGNA
jgi:hypothetical protein